MNVLFILIEFPPINSAGMRRPLRFINYLAEKNINVGVVTLKFDDLLRWPKEHIDYDLINQIHPKVKVFRVGSDVDDMDEAKYSKFKFFLYTYFNVTDKFKISWQRNFNKEIPSIINDFKPNYLVTSIPPFSIALLASEISKKYNIPLILDQRDAWSQLAMMQNATYFHYKYKLHIEKKVYQNAYKIVTVTPQMLKAIVKVQPTVNQNKFSIIFNSFNDSNFNYNTTFTYQPKQEIDYINIGYTGSFYYSPEAHKTGKANTSIKQKIASKLAFYPVVEDWLYRTPYFFLKVLKLIQEKNSDSTKKIIFHHIGNTPEWLYQMIENLELNIQFISHGYLKEQEVQQLQNSFDLLLATSEKVSNQDHYCLPSKLFSYMFSYKPIIGFVTDGIQKDFIEKSNIGLAFNPDNLHESSEKLTTFFRKGISNKLNQDYLQQFTNQKTNQQFLDLFI